MRYLPFILFAVIAVVLGVTLRLEPDATVNSPLVNQPVPAFSLNILDGDTTLESTALRGQVMVINFFASWCVACIAEHEVLSRFAHEHGVTVYGIAWKDKEEDTRAWLRQRGNPYKAVLTDPTGKAAIAFGISGIPESFVIDKHGVIRSRIAGPIIDDMVTGDLLPLVEKLRHEP